MKHLLILYSLFVAILSFGQNKQAFIGLERANTDHDTYYRPAFKVEAYHTMLGVGNLHDSVLSISWKNILETGSLEQEQLADSLTTKSNAPTNTLTLIVDTLLYTMKEMNLTKQYPLNSVYSPYPKQLRLSVKGRRRNIPITKDTSLFVTAQPVFIANTSTEFRYLVGPSGNLLIAQQAKDKNGKWKDIEKNNVLGCGMQRYICELKPNEFVLTSVYRFKGSFKTQLRIKLETANHTYYSEPFTGYIDYEQLENPKLKIVNNDLYERF